MVKNLTCVCLKVFSDLKVFLRSANAPEQCKILKSAPYIHFAINMMLIYNITAVAFCMSLPKYRKVTLAANDVASYTPC